MAEKDELRPEYSRADFGKGVRGKYHQRFKQGTNIVVLEPEIAKEFPTSEAVNEALREVLRKCASRGNSLSLDSENDSDIEAARLTEIKRRVNHLDSGSTRMIPWEDVQDRLRQRLDAEQTRWQRWRHPHQLLALAQPAQGHPTATLQPVQGKHPLCQIDPNDSNLAYVFPSLSD